MPLPGALAALVLAGALPCSGGQSVARIDIVRHEIVRDLRGDVGVRLLIGRNRLTANRPGVRFDLAYAFNPAPGRGRWLLSAGSSFGFLD